MRVLVTGSRGWTDREAVQRAFADIGARPWDTLVVGDAVGADRIAAEVWTQMGPGSVEVHRARWDAYGRNAGPRRNQEMVDSGVDVCLAFVLECNCNKYPGVHGSHGTVHCARAARKAGVPVLAYGPGAKFA